MPSDKAYTVRAAYCHHESSDEVIYQTLKKITEPLERSWEKLESAETIVIKMNIMMPEDRVRRIGGRRQELVDDAVVDASLRLLRERTRAKLLVTDTQISKEQDEMTVRHLLARHGAEFVESKDLPLAMYQVPGRGLMFRQYQLSSVFKDADAVVSLATLKSHQFMGLTLCCKNLFGLPPLPPQGHRLRTYFHHVIRLSYVLPDLGLITRPVLNIIDALAGQSGREWGGEGRICDALIAGDHVIATDACGAWLMGHDPASDWPTPPFRRERNHLRVAAQAGFGTVNLDEIDFQSEVDPPLADFDSDLVDAPEVLASLRRSACHQALFYRERQSEITDQFAGDFIFLQDGEVIWHGPDPQQAGNVQQVAGKKPDQAVWLKKADPEEQEGEQFGVYEKILAGLAPQSLSKSG